MAGVNRVGETVIANNGMEMEIIRYKNSDDISVRFKDGYVVEHTTYGTFISRNIRNPNVAYYPSTQRLLNLQATRLGQQIKASNGMMMKIIAYRKTDDIDVQFEDGEIVTNKEYHTFLKGRICHPKSANNDIVRSRNLRVGEKNQASNGMEICIYYYNNRRDIGVRFEDGTEVPNQRYDHFLEGAIRYPKELPIGEIRTAKNGLKMKLVAWRNANDVDVLFEDDTLVTGKSYGNFKKGVIKNPNYKYSPSASRSAKQATKYVGTTKMSNFGMSMTIIAYRSYNDIDVQFEDGFIREHAYLRSFLRGEISHDTGYTLNNVMFQKFAYEYAGIRNFYCRCKKCGKEDIMSIQEVKDHIC